MVVYRFSFIPFVVAGLFVFALVSPRFLPLLRPSAKGNGKRITVFGESNLGEILSAEQASLCKSCEV